MPKRPAAGTRFTDASEQRARRSRETASLWKLAKAAIRLVDSSKSVRTGIYEACPSAMLALRSVCDDVRFSLKMQELEIRKAEAEGECDDE